VRIPIISLAAVILASIAVPSAAREFVNLERPGALATVERDHPEHLARIARVLRVADDMPCQTPRFGSLIRMELGVGDAGCALLLMTSYPSKRVLSFTIDDTRYTSVVTMKDPSRIVPAQ
jgi:hypothetical protein